MNDIINSFSEDSKEPLTTVQLASTVDEIKYLVFKSSLLELFKQCTLCQYPLQISIMILQSHFIILVAAMHFNENFGRAQATTKSGAERIRIVFPKQKAGDFTPKIVLVPKTYSKQTG